MGIWDADHGSIIIYSTAALMIGHDLDEAILSSRCLLVTKHKLIKLKAEHHFRIFMFNDVLLVPLTDFM